MSTIPAVSPGKDVEVFFDGACPLCMREIRMLRSRDHAQKIQFTDIAAPTFDAHTYATTQAELMAKIRGRLPDGTWIEGVEVFRRLWGAVGFRRLVAFSRLWGVSHLLRGFYHLFAKHRLRLTGRCAPDGACALPTAPAPAPVIQP
jgi:predicted DCC family thiol-disulfide oxidoreductase YuxK